MFVERQIRQSVLTALTDTPVVFVMGPRQAGKSTLVQSIAAHEHAAKVLTLDDLSTRTQAEADPGGLLLEHEGNLVIDEVQRVPDLILAIKAAVDRDRRPGRFLLTGSANVLRSRKVSESLTGRIEHVTLWPLSQCEVDSVEPNFVPNLMRGIVPQITRATQGREAWIERALRGGFPDAVNRGLRSRNRWFDAYLKSTLESDVQNVADIYKEFELPRLFARLAANSSQIANWSRIARDLSIKDKTAAAYTGILDAVFLVHILPAWRPAMIQRVLHSPKIHVVDSGLLCRALGANATRLQSEPELAGQVLESFVVMEVIKQLAQLEDAPAAFHFRDRDDHEVDLVLEDRGGTIGAIEVKSSTAIHGRDLRGLRALRDRCGNRFQAGVLIYTGAETLRIEDRIWAVPVSGIWSPRSERTT